MSRVTDRSVYRILDASINRASEGFRTLEECARFVLDDSMLSEQLKALRHRFTSSVAELPREQLLRSRDTPGDVGTEITVPSEANRDSLQAVIAAAAARVQQSLRVIEEYSKTLPGELAAEIEQVRYESYTASAQLELTTNRLDRRRQLASAQLYYLIDAGESDDDMAAKIESLAPSGVDVFQLRAPGCDDRTLFQRSLIASAAARRAGALFIVNDRPDIAVASGADGVHVGQEELPCAAVRSVVGESMLIGISTHSIEQADQAVQDGADYLGCGPVFPSNTKQFDTFAGTEFLTQVSTKVTIPSFAIGGIDLQNLPQVLDTGFVRIAVSAAISRADDPAAAAQSLRDQLPSQTSDR